MRIIVEANAGYRKILAQVGVVSQPTIEQIKAIDKDFKEICDGLWANYEGLKNINDVYQIALKRACEKHVKIAECAEGHVVGRLIW